MMHQCFGYQCLLTIAALAFKISLQHSYLIMHDRKHVESYELVSGSNNNPMSTCMPVDNAQNDPGALLRTVRKANGRAPRQGVMLEM